MPELPEVEIAVRSLAELLAGRSVVSAGLYREKLAPLVNPSRFEKVLSGAAFLEITRRGKHILIALDNGYTLIVHLRMSGRFQIFEPKHENPKFTHAEFFLDDDNRLVFSDQRHFGFMNLVPTSKLFLTKELRDLAPEPFSKEFSKSYMRDTLRSSKRQIKELLLDQKRICGLGNIYASEALFMSRINPSKKAHEVSAIKTNRLRDNIRKVLKESIDYGSTLRIDPLNLESRYYGGDYEGEWRVYDRENEPCINCARPIRRIVQGGRSSYFCPKCQKSS